MKFGVITFPGSNCDQDMILALERLDYQVNKLWHKDTDLQDSDCVILPGGFSYGDYLRSGAIARFSPIMDSVVRFAQKGGYVLGVCNGFQILTEAGLLPGVLRRNANTQFICKNVYIKPANTQAGLTRGLEDKPYCIPIAHGEGNYYCDDDTLAALEDQGNILFRYTDALGNTSDASNPNGAIHHIAGIQNSNGNVMGMMPHPERASDPILNNTDGSFILRALAALQ
jgi:phosphoribosylformylglycinamidine synthase